MIEAVRQERDGAVAILVVDAPPVNALGQDVRRGLAEGLAAALADPGVRAVVIAAAGRIFSAGADIREFGQPPAPDVPLLPELCNRIEASAKPVVAALQGDALGGGMELALAAHVRLAAPEVRLGLPEVTLGLCPGAGGTQRLPRIAGAEVALRLMLTGRSIGATEAQAAGVVDAVVAEDLRGAAVALAAELAAEGAAPRRSADRREGMRDGAAYLAAVAAARAAHAADRLPAPGRIIAAVEAAQLLPFEQGLAFERAAFEDLRASPESAGLRHAFQVERRLRDYPEARAVARAVASVGVVGLGRTGAAIAHLLIGAGVPVTVAEKDADALVAGLERIADLQERDVATGRLSAAARDADWDRLVPTLALSALGAVDLVIEAVPEDPAAKTAVLRDIAAVARPGAVIATTGAWTDMAALASLSGRAADVVGLRLGVPVGRMALAELGVGPATAPEAVATLATLLRRLCRVVVREAAAPGLVGHRMIAALRTAADFLLEDGATPQQVDTALRAWGFAMGPYQAADLAGLEKAWAHRQRLTPGRDPAARYCELADLLVESGRLGQETGRGYYLYDEGRPGREDGEVLALLAELRAAKGIVPRPVGSAEIVARCLGALANEGARILGEGLVPRAGDIDAVLLAGYGFPRWEGGPMFWADRKGLLVLRAELRRHADQAPEFWAVAPLIDDLIRQGRTLHDLGA
jgi:3-hydroxyacyl-CoA dehydrogenase